LLWCEHKSGKNCVDTEQFAGNRDGISGHRFDVGALDVLAVGALLEGEGRSVVRREGNLEVEISVGNIFVGNFESWKELLLVDEGKGNLGVGVVVDADGRGVVQSDNVEVNVEGGSCCDGSGLWECQ